jgi:hypothetical protein
VVEDGDAGVPALSRLLPVGVDVADEEVVRTPLPVAQAALPP